MKDKGKLKDNNSSSYTNNMIRADIEECISKSHSYEEFVDLIQDKGHTYDDNGKYITIKAPGRSRACRIINLTPDKVYTKDNILNMINGIFLDKNKVKEELFREWNDYNQEYKVVLSYKYEIDYVRMLEERQLADKHRLSDRRDLKIYIAYINECDKQLNIMRKNINKILTVHDSNFQKLDEIIRLYKTYKDYKQTGNDCYKEGYERCLKLYGELKMAGYDMYKMYLYREKAQGFIDNINAYKKHMYVQKKVALRIDNKYQENSNNRTHRTEKSLYSGK